MSVREPNSRVPQAGISFCDLYAQKHAVKDAAADRAARFLDAEFPPSKAALCSWACATRPGYHRGEGTGRH